MRKIIHDELRTAQSSSDLTRLATLRLIETTIADHDKKVRDSGAREGISDNAILDIIYTMIRQREKSSRNYEEMGRIDQLDKEVQELKILNELLPSKLNQNEVEHAVRSAIKSTGSTSIRHKGHVMCALKNQYRCQMDFQKVGKLVENMLQNQ